ncbi:MAG: ZIP family metal transporter [Candidatus Dormibacteria bacterium]
MSFGQTLALGAFSGLTLFIGLPIARLHKLSRNLQSFMTAVALGVLFFLLVDILGNAGAIVTAALDQGRTGHGWTTFEGLAAIYVLGFVGGLMGLVLFDKLYRARVTHVAPGTKSTVLALLIAVGLGLHNFSEGLTIGASSAASHIELALLLIIGFGLHNITEGFAIAAPVSADPDGDRSWRFLGMAGLIGGGPTFLGTAAGYALHADWLQVLFYTLAAGAVVNIIGKLFAVGARVSSLGIFGWGVVFGFTAGWGTDLVLKAAGA